MVKKPSEMVDQVIENMRGGNGSVLQHHILKGDDMARHSRLFCTLTLKPGASIGEHSHVDETEYYYILSGKGLVTEAAGTFEVGPGDVVITGDGASHSIEAIGDEDLVFVAIIILD